MQQGSDAARTHRPAGRCVRQPQAPRPQDSSTAVHFRENAVHFHEHAQMCRLQKQFRPHPRWQLKPERPQQAAHLIAKRSFHFHELIARSEQGLDPMAIGRFDMDGREPARPQHLGQSESVRLIGLDAPALDGIRRSPGIHANHRNAHRRHSPVKVWREGPRLDANLNELFLNRAMQLTPGRLDVVCERLGWDRIGLQRAFDKAVKQLAARA